MIFRWNGVAVTFSCNKRDDATESESPEYSTVGYRKPDACSGGVVCPAKTTARRVAGGVAADGIGGCFVGVVAGVALPLSLRVTTVDETDLGGRIDSKAGSTKVTSSVGSIR